MQPGHGRASAGVLLAFHSQMQYNRCVNPVDVRGFLMIHDEQPGVVSGQSADSQ